MRRNLWSRTNWRILIYDRNFEEKNIIRIRIYLRYSATSLKLRFLGISSLKSVRKQYRDFQSRFNTFSTRFRPSKEERGEKEISSSLNEIKGNLKLKRDCTVCREITPWKPKSIKKNYSILNSIHLIPKNKKGK